MIKKIIFNRGKGKFKNMVISSTFINHPELLFVNNILYNEECYKEVYLDKIVVIDINDLKIMRMIDSNKIKNDYSDYIDKMIKITDSGLNHDKYTDEEASDLYMKFDIDDLYITFGKKETPDIQKIVICENEDLNRFSVLSLENNNTVFYGESKVSYDTFQMLQDDFIEISFK